MNDNLDKLFFGPINNPVRQPYVRCEYWHEGEQCELRTEHKNPKHKKTSGRRWE